MHVVWNFHAETQRRGARWDPIWFYCVTSDGLRIIKIPVDVLRVSASLREKKFSPDQSLELFPVADVDESWILRDLCSGLFRVELNGANQITHHARVVFFV